jgi:hypothetical protein
LATQLQEFSKIIFWGADGDEFVVRDVVRLEALVLPRYFRHAKINSFVRQLNMYGFQKTKHSPFRSTFRHPHFRRDAPYFPPDLATTCPPSGANSPIRPNAPTSRRNKQ